MEELQRLLADAESPQLKAAARHSDFAEFLHERNQLSHPDHSGQLRGAVNKA
jgi:hypothetical protein